MAAFFWIHTGANANWNTTGNWSATSGGGSNASTPSVTSDVTFDGAGTHGNEASIVSANQSVLSLTFTSGYTQSVTINTAITLTIAGNFTDNTAHSWVVSGTGAMTISAASSINSGGKTFPGPVTFSGANTKTLVTNSWTITGTLTISGTTVLNWTTAETITTGGLVNSSGISGTAGIIIVSGTWSGALFVGNNLTLSTGSITISGSVGFSGTTLTNSSATVTTTGSTLTLSGSANTLNTSGITWNNITSNAASTITLTSALVATGTYTITASFAITFAGTFGWTFGTLTCSHTVAATITLANTVTYTITTAFNCLLTRIGSIVLFTSDHATNKAILILKYGATCNVLASFTRIDSSAGRPILSFNGTITTCINVFAYTDVQANAPILKRGLGRRSLIYNRAKAVIYQ